MRFNLIQAVKKLHGDKFKGSIAVWDRQTKSTDFFGPDELDRFESEVEDRKGQQDLYIGLSTQPNDLPPRSRGTSETAISLPGIVFDVDFANSKDSTKRYPPNMATALALVESFEMKPFLVQHSGNGLHVLYAADAPLVMDNREDRRKAQAILTKAHRRMAAHFNAAGFEIDNVSDLARVFRVPGTFNHKGGMHKPVKVLAYTPENRFSWSDFDDDPEPSVPAAGRKATLFKNVADHVAIQSRCGWYGSITGPDAATTDEPNWYAGASITARCRGGEEIFHEYSKAHPGYRHAEAAAKFKRAGSEAGPRTCAAVRDDLGNQRFCDECPHFGKITSPIELGNDYDPGDTGPRPLGFTRDGDYVLLDPERQIIITASAQQLLAQQFLVGLAPSGFWADRFPSAKSAFNSYAAGEAIIAACKRAGPFVPSRVRGRGIWLEDDKIIANLGDEVTSSKGILYLCFEPLEIEASPSFDGARLLRLLELLPWRSPQDAMLMLGWLALAPICGVLAWRPHMFVYGPPNSGKTTLHRLVTALLKPLVVSADGQSTEAGLRQTLGPDSLPIAIDEFETDQREGRLKAIIRLARSASSAEAPLLRGTPEGKAMTFSLRTMFFFSAINVTGMSPADETRIMAVELHAHANDLDIGRQIENEVTQFGEMGPKWAGYMASQALHIKAAIDLIKAEIHNVDSRHRQNMGTLLAGAFVALNGRIPTTVEAAEWALKYASSVEHHGLAHERDDASEALFHLLQHPVRGGDGLELPLGHWLGSQLEALRADRKANALPDHTRIVANMDIKIELKGANTGWLIRSGSPAIDRVYADTRWANGAWRRALGQIEEAFTPKLPIYFPSIHGKARALGLPLDRIPEPMSPTPKENKSC